VGRSSYSVVEAMSRREPRGRREAKAPAQEDEPTTRIVRGRALTGAGEDEEPTLPIPADAVQAVLAQHGVTPPEHATAVVPPPRRAPSGHAERNDPRSTLPGEPSDGSVDVVFDPTTGEIVAREIRTILEEAVKLAPLPAAPAEPPTRTVPRDSDPDTHGAEIEYDPDKTRRNRRP
jgi:hypothetical protein